MSLQRSGFSDDGEAQPSHLVRVWLPGAQVEKLGDVGARQTYRILELPFL